MQVFWIWNKEIKGCVVEWQNCKTLNCSDCLSLLGVFEDLSPSDHLWSFWLSFRSYPNLPHTTKYIKKDHFLFNRHSKKLAQHLKSLLLLPTYQIHWKKKNQPIFCLSVLWLTDQLKQLFIFRKFFTHPMLTFMCCKTDIR